MSETSFVVGAIEFLKKLTTTELKRSRSAGNRRNACYVQTQYRQHTTTTRTHDLVQELPEDADELVVHQLAALQTRLLEPHDLLLHNDLKRGSSDEKRRCRTLHPVSF